jgi:hypothetical protein
MKTYFADTFYFLALFNARDEHHDRVATWLRGKRFRTVTTEFVLAEFGDEFRKPPRRDKFLSVLDDLRVDPTVTIVPASPDWVEQGTAHYRLHADKEWGLTDCISFVVMATLGLSEALTFDRHFEQAGYRAMLRKEP